MALYGSLKDMSVADLIQHNCQDQKTGLLTIDHSGKRALIYFKNGAVVHAVIGSTVGEDAVYQVINWDDGRFVLEIGNEAPTVTIKRSWSGLLLEGAKRLDETNPSHLFSPDGDGSHRREGMLNDILINFLTNSKTYSGAILIDLTGGTQAACLENPSDQETLSTIAAAALNFANRSLKLSNQGKFVYTIIQGENGTLVVASVDPSHLLIALSPEQKDPHNMKEELNQVCANLVGLL